MKTVLLLSSVLLVAAAAPTNTEFENEDAARMKKSAYGAPAYSAPCAGGPGLAPIALYLSAAPQQAGPHYRENDHAETEHSEHKLARSYYEEGAAQAPAAGPGHAIGVFPNAKVGGCATPLLLSCSPNVVSGQLVKQHNYGYAAPSYREDGAPHMRESMDQMHQTIQEPHKHRHHDKHEMPMNH